VPILDKWLKYKDNKDVHEHMSLIYRCDAAHSHYLRLEFWLDDDISNERNSYIWIEEIRGGSLWHRIKEALKQVRTGYIDELVIGNDQILALYEELGPIVKDIVGRHEQ
jgi:hypothetical protein